MDNGVSVVSLSVQMKNDREPSRQLVTAPPLAINNHQREGQLLPEIGESEAGIQEGSESSDKESQTMSEATASVLKHVTHIPMSRNILLAGKFRSSETTYM